MSYDFLGQMFGKARRRKIEAAAQQVLTGGGKPVAVDFGVLGTRLATGATLALLSATLNHTLPSTAGGILTVAGIGLTGALPTALKSSGLRTALSPDTLSAVQGLGQAVSGMLAAPANARKAAFQSAVATEVQAALNRTSMTGFTAGELGQKELNPVPALQQDGSSALEEATNGAATATGGETAITASDPDPKPDPKTDPAVAATGGNQ